MCAHVTLFSISFFFSEIFIEWNCINLVQVSRFHPPASQSFYSDRPRSLQPLLSTFNNAANFSLNPCSISSVQLTLYLRQPGKANGDSSSSPSSSHSEMKAFLALSLAQISTIRTIGRFVCEVSPSLASGG